MTRRLISRREPVITLKSLRYRGRNYKEGDHLDRRRVRMPHTKLVRLIREGVCILAKDLDTDKLNSYGYVYDTSLRYRLAKYIIKNKTEPQKENETKSQEAVIKPLPWDKQSTLTS